MLSNFSNQRILVTGASGFIGSHLCLRLCKEGAEVHAISRVHNTECSDGVRWWLGDLAEIASVQNIMAKINPDIIFHLAGYPVGSRGLEHVLPSFRNNLMSTVNLLTVASEIGCQRIVLAGSLEEPDGSGDLKAVSSSPYAVAKWSCSAYARMFHALYALPVVMMRVFMVYGPAQQDLNKIIPYTIISSLKGQPPMLTSGQRQVDWIFVEDVVEAFLVAAHAKNIEGATLDVGSGQLTSIQTVVEQITCMINPLIKPSYGAMPDRPYEQIRVADTKKTYDLVGWKTLISLEEGLKRTTNWYSKQAVDQNLYKNYMKGTNYGNGQGAH